MGLARRSHFRPGLESLEDRRLLTGGALDFTFGTSGQVVSGLTLPGVADSAHAVAVQSDHKIVVVGADRTQPSQQTTAQNDDFALVRYNTDGSLDTSFGNGGRVSTDFGGRDTAEAVALQADGKIVVVGTVANSAYPYTSETAVIARYNTDGSLDTSFGTGGMVTTDFGGGSSADSVVLQADGSIIVVGSAGESTTATMAVARYTPDGHLDATFGNNGVATASLAFQVLNAPTSGPSRAAAVTLQSDGKIVVAGNGQYGFGIVRLNADGSADATFGTAGQVVLTNVDHATGVAVQADGRIVVAGDAYDSARADAVALYRFNADGTSDAGFGTAGRVQTQLGARGAANGLALEADGTILVTGDAGGDFALLRYQADGSPDATFGKGGKVTTDFGSFDSAAAVAVLPNGKIVVAGTTGGGGGQDGGTFAVARYRPGGALDAAFGKGGLVTTDFPRQIARTGSAVAVQPDGKVVVAGYAPLPSDPAPYPGATLDHPVDVVLSRYNADGSPDLTFGTRGQSAARFLNFQDSPLTVEGITLQADGKIVVVGHSTDNGGDFAVERFNADGSLDGSFGNGGQVTTDFGGGADEAFAAAVQPNGKIVVVGGNFNANHGFRIALTRYLPDGSLDPKFGTGGRLTTTFGALALASSIVLQPDGEILVAGVTAQAGLSTAHFALLRYNPNGTLDGSFGNGGEVTGFAGVQSVANALALQPDGSIVVAGVAGSGAGEALALARYTPGGALDPTFGNGGKVRTTFAGPVSPVGVAVRPDGTIVVAGTLGDDGFGTATPRGFALAQYKHDGSADLGFGTGGQLTTDFGSPGTYDARGLAVDGHGNVLVAGTTGSGDSRQALVARFQDGTRTVTTLTTSPPAIVHGTPVTITATVSPVVAGLLAPSGTVQFQIDGVNVGSPVAVAGGSSTSAAIPSPTTGTHVLTAVYSGDGTYNGSTGTKTKTVGRATPQLSVTDAGGTYNGSAFPATAAISGLDGTQHHGLEGVGLSLTYYAGKKAAGAPLPGEPTAAGTYTVVTSFGGSANYSPAQASATFTIQKAVSAVTVSDAGGTYNGSPYPASAWISGLDGTQHHGLEGVGLSLTYYAGSTAAGKPLVGPPTAAGTYTVVASFGGSADYAAAQSTPATFSIQKAVPAVFVSDAGGAYRGAPFPALATVTGVSGKVTSALEGVYPTLTYYAGSTAAGAPLSGAPSAVGTYTVVASFGGSADYAFAQAFVTFTISAIGKPPTS